MHALLGVVILISMATTLPAQRSSATWVFGADAGLSFIGTNGTIDGTVRQYAAPPIIQREGNAVWCDPETGLLELYTDSSTVRDAQGVAVPGVGRSGTGISSTQAAIFVPHPSSADTLFLFMAPDLTADASVRERRHSYLVLGRPSKNAPWRAVRTNVRLPGDGTERLCAMHDDTRQGYWVFTVIDDVFLTAWHVTSTGVLPQPAVTELPQRVETIGQMKVSRNGKLLAFVNTGAFEPASLTVCRLNGATGTAERWGTVGLADIAPIGPGHDKLAAYGVSFSAGSGKLYVTVEAGLDTFLLVQFDCRNTAWADVVASAVVIGTVPRAYLWPPGLQLGPDGAIYVAGNKAIGSIRHPEAEGLACAYIPRFVPLVGDVRGYDGLPSIIESSLGPFAVPSVTLVAPGVCEGDSLVVTASVGTGDVTDLLWFTDDRPDDTLRSGLELRLPPRPAGSYAVRCVVVGTDAIVTQYATVVVYPRPAVDGGPDRTVCEGLPVRLEATGARTYRWEPADLVLVADPSGVLIRPVDVDTVLYVEGIDDRGCVGRDSVRLYRYRRTARLVGDTRACPGTEVTLEVRHADATLWIDGPFGVGSTAPSVNGIVTATATFRVVVTEGPCHDTLVHTIVVDQSEAISIARPDSICAGTAVRLEAVGPVTGWRWEPEGSLDDPSRRDPVATPDVTTTYTVTAVDAGGCEVMASVTVVVGGTYGITVDLTAVDGVVGDTVVLPVTIDRSAAATRYGIAFPAGAVVPLDVTPGSIGAVDRGAMHDTVWIADGVVRTGRTDYALRVMPLLGPSATIPLTGVAVGTTACGIREGRDGVLTLAACGLTLRSVRFGPSATLVVRRIADRTVLVVRHGTVPGRLRCSSPLGHLLLERDWEGAGETIAELGPEHGTMVFVELYDAGRRSTLPLLLR